MAVCLKDDLGIRCRPEFVAVSCKLSLELPKIVDLSIVDDADLPIVGDHGLLCGGRQIDNRQAAMAEPDGTLDPNAFSIRATMGDSTCHGRDQIAVNRLMPVEVQDSCNSAHTCA